MTEVGVRELKEHTSEILRRLRETKETVIVTYRGRAIAKLIPVEDLESRKAEARAVLAEIDKLAQEIGRSWPPEISAVDAVREQRREL